MQTIICDEAEIEAAHKQEDIGPYSYFNAKNFKWNNMREEINAKSNFVLGIATAKLGYLMKEYNTA